MGNLLRVLTWNMGMAQTVYAAKHDDAWRYVLQAADVALLQETVPPDWVTPDAIHFLRKYPGLPWGTAVLSPRLRLAAVATDDRAQRWLTAMPGSAVVADVSMPTKVLRVASLHPRAEATDPGFTGDADMTGVKAAYQSTAFPVDLVHHDLAPLLTGRRFLIGGDLNSALRFDLVRGRDSRTYGNADLFQKFRDSGWRDCHLKFHAGEERTFFRGDERYMLDHVYADNKTYGATVSCEVVARETVDGLSDHSPILTVLDVDGDD